jgi:hypothetical protein
MSKYGAEILMSVRLQPRSSTAVSNRQVGLDRPAKPVHSLWFSITENICLQVPFAQQTERFYLNLPPQS